MQTSEILPPQSLRNRKKENLLPPSRRKTTKLPSKTKLSTSAKRIQELAEITLDPLPNCSARPKGDSIYEWRSTIHGPPGSVYEGDSFFLDITLPSDYPFKPPKVSFRTRIHHCNTNSRGVIRWDILKDNWSPTVTLSGFTLYLFPSDIWQPCGSSGWKHSHSVFDQQSRTRQNSHTVDQEVATYFTFVCSVKEQKASSHCAADLYSLYNIDFCVCIILTLALPLSSGDWETPPKM